MNTNTTYFFARYTVKEYDNHTATNGMARYDSENEMYADLEVQDITNENPKVLALEFMEVQNGEVLRKWN